MVGVTHRSIKVENGVKSTARANPFIDGLPFCFSVSGVVVSALIGSQCSAEYLDSMFVSPLNYLLQASYDLLGTYSFAGERRFLSRRTILQWSWLDIGPADVVGALQHGQVGDAGFSQHVMIEPCQRTSASTIVQDAIAADSFVDHRQVRGGRLASHETCQNIRPVTVVALLRSNTISNRIAQSHNRPGSIRRPH